MLSLCLGCLLGAFWHHSFPLSEGERVVSGNHVDRQNGEACRLGNLCGLGAGISVNQDVTAFTVGLNFVLVLGVPVSDALSVHDLLVFVCFVADGVTITPH
jgi:hypothetical protein